MFEGKKILITGGTGSLGSALAKKLLETDLETLRIFSRDAVKQIDMKEELDDARLRFLIGDVRDKDRLRMAVNEIDIVIHAAALKHIDVAEYNPFEAVKTNVEGTQNLIESCLEKNVKFVLGIGTDKAVSPYNTYGASKLLMERLLLSANNYRGSSEIMFSCVRYGNVFGSAGSIVPKIINQIKKGQKVKITDPNMTRFNITMNEAINLIFRSLKNSLDSEILIPKLKAYRLADLVESLKDLLDYHGEFQRIPVRPGEKIHECLISKSELRSAYENDQDYLLLNKFEGKAEPNINNSLRKIGLDDEYSSDKVDLLTKTEIKEIIKNSGLISEYN